MSDSNFTRSLFTGVDNRTWDIGRILWAVSVVVGLGLVIHAQLADKAFDIQNYGIGIGALLTGGGLGLKLKENTEPAHMSSAPKGQ